MSLRTIVIEIAGPPGIGKSQLARALLEPLKTFAREHKVGMEVYSIQPPHRALSRQLELLISGEEKSDAATSAD